MDCLGVWSSYRIGIWVPRCIPVCEICEAKKEEKCLNKCEDATKEGQATFCGSMGDGMHLRSRMWADGVRNCVITKTLMGVFHWLL